MELYQKIQSPITNEIEKLGKKIEGVLQMYYHHQKNLIIENRLRNENKKRHMIDVFHDIDKEILDKYNISRIIVTREEIENILENVLTEKLIRDIAVKQD